jgi:CDP-glucose 4,6-dehydratase
MVKRQRALGDMESEITRSFWRGRSVLLTGHTGFKGGWLATWLLELGARVTGYSLAPDTELSYFSRCRLDRHVNSVLADIRDLHTLKQTIADVQPEIVFHLAAQPLVRHSYIEPAATFETNVMGTVNLLEAMRAAPSVKAGVIVTSDKCYQNREWVWGYREDDVLGGQDPYSASKACAEIVTDAYRKSFLGLNGHRAAVATARAGNVIGGGDWAADRLLPDAVRALRRNAPLVLRNPDSVRPWQHVLEPLAGYIMLAQKLYYDGERYSGAFNFASNEEDAIPVAELAEITIRHWGAGSWQAATGSEANSSPREAGYLRLDSGKARQLLGWRPRLPLEQAVKMTIDWYREALRRPESDMYDLSRCQLHTYEHAVPHRNAERSGQPRPTTA